MFTVIITSSLFWHDLFLKSFLAKIHMQVSTFSKVTKGPEVRKRTESGINSEFVALILNKNETVTTCFSLPVIIPMMLRNSVLIALLINAWHPR